MNPRAKRFPGELNSLLRVGLVVELACASALAVDAPNGKAVLTNAPKTYMRVHRPDSNTVHLQICARRFAPIEGTGPTLWLSGVSHLGETNYFRALQEHLEAQTLVLYEGVKGQTDGESAFSEHSQARANASATGTEAKKGGAEAQSLQSTLAASLGLAFQLEAIDYSRPHFRHSDLSIEKIAKLMEARIGDGTNEQTASTEFSTLMELMTVVRF